MKEISGSFGTVHRADWNGSVCCFLVYYKHVFMVVSMKYSIYLFIKWVYAIEIVDEYGDTRFS
jgi:hypothetical protein